MLNTEQSPPEAGVSGRTFKCWSDDGATWTLKYIFNY